MRTYLHGVAEKLHDLFAIGAPDTMPQDVMEALFADYYSRVRSYDDEMRLFNDAVTGRRFFVAPLNAFGTHSGKQVWIMGTQFDGIDVEGERYTQWVRNDPGLLMPTDR